MIENKWKDVPMPEMLRTSLEEFLAAQDDPKKQRLMDCYRDELEGSIKACWVWHSIPDDLARELLGLVC